MRVVLLQWHHLDNLGRVVQLRCHSRDRISDRSQRRYPSTKAALAAHSRRQEGSLGIFVRDGWTDRQKISTQLFVYYML